MLAFTGAFFSSLSRLPRPAYPVSRVWNCEYGRFALWRKPAPRPAYPASRPVYPSRASGGVYGRFGWDAYVSPREISGFARRIGTTSASPYVTEFISRRFSRKLTYVVAKFYVNNGALAQLTRNAR